MDAAADRTSLTAIRWGTAAALLTVCGALVGSLSGGASTPAVISHPLGLMAVALAAYAWILYPPTGSVIVSLVVFLCLVWAWAVHRAAALSLDLVAFVVLLSVAAQQQRRRFRRTHRLRQTLEDVEEEGSVKEQAIVQARQVNTSLQKKQARYTQVRSIAEQVSNLP